MNSFDAHILHKNYKIFEEICQENNLLNLLKVLSDDERKSVNNTDSRPFLLRVCCNWMNSETLCLTFGKLAPKNTRIKLTSSVINDATFIFNKPFDDEEENSIVPEKTYYFHFDLRMEQFDHIWGRWKGIPVLDKNGKEIPFKKIITLENNYNFINWFIQKTHSQLSLELIQKPPENTLSVLLSNENTHIGHIHRLDFFKYLETLDPPPFKFDIYGENDYEFKNFRGGVNKKESVVYPYRYTLGCEANYDKNYFTEIITDAILAETLIFYSGCLNMSALFDERAFIYIDLHNPETACKQIKNAIAVGAWERRLPYIKAEKQRILNELQFFKMAERVLWSEEKEATMEIPERVASEYPKEFLKK